MSVTNERVRGWVLLQADSPEETAVTLYNAQAEAGDDRYVVIRADVVAYVYNIVIPVDAASMEWLQEAHRIIRDITGVSNSLLIPVVQHIPFPPQDAQGYITPPEAELGKEPVEQIGRQHWSPGHNAWG